VGSSSTNTLGRYQIVREIARSNDIVYEAIDPSINRRIALKELSVPVSATGEERRERIERFWREGKAAGRLSHPNIVTIFEVGREGDRHFIAMEFLEGQTLRDVIKAGGALSIREATGIAAQICSAMAYAHANGVVHRDIKPENIQILPGGHVKVTDFGIARLMGEPAITQNGQVFGTPSYMSPEQVAGKEIDARSDIFSLGVLLYEMISGQKPFTGDSVVTITYNIMNMEPAAAAGVPHYVNAIVKKAMSKDPAMRYQSAEELAADLASQRCSDAITTGPPAYASPAAAPDPFAGTSPAAPPPDPFAPVVGGSVPVMLPPPRPLMSAESRAFLGVLLIGIAILGALAFSGWAVSLAYKSYVRSVNAQDARRYLEQGNKLYAEGKTQEALTQWKLAAERSSDSRTGETAREAMYAAVVTIAKGLAVAESSESLREAASELISIRPKRPEGHYYMGYAAHLAQDAETAKKEYALAIDYGGGDYYAQEARRQVGPIYLREGEGYAASGRIREAAEAYDKAAQYGDAGTQQIAQE